MLFWFRVSGLGFGSEATAFFGSVEFRTQGLCFSFRVGLHGFRV